MANSKTYELMLKIGGKADSSLKKACEAADKNLSAIGETAAKIGKAAAAAIAAGATAVSGLAVAAVKNAAEYESQLSNISTLLTGTAEEIAARTAEIGEQVLDISNRTGVATADLTDGMYQVISAFGDSADAASILETAAKSAAAGNATTTDSINLLSAVTKGYGDTSSEAVQKAADLAFATVRLGQTSFPELAAGIGKVIPLASTLGVEQEQLFGAMATLTGVTGSTAEVVTQLKATMQGFLSPSKDMAAVLESLGYASGQALLESEGLQGALTTLKDAVGGDELAFAGLFSSVEAQTAVLAMAGNQAENLASKTAEMYEATGAADAAFAAQTDNLNYLISSIKNLGTNFLTAAGTKILPYIKDLAEQALPVLQEWLGKLMDKLPEIGAYVTGTIIPTAKNVWEWIQKNKTVLVALAAGIGTALVAFKGISIVSSIVKVFQAFGGVGKVLTGVLGGMNLKLMLIAAVIGAVVAAGVWLYQNWDTVKAKAAELGAKIVEIWGNIKAWVTDAVSNLVSAFQENFPLLSAFVSGWWESIQDAWENVKAIFSGIVDFVKNVFSGNWEDAWQNIVDIFGNVFGLIVNLAKAPINGVISAINWVLEKINSISVTIPDWVPGVGGQILGFNIPTIPALASGGIATAPTLAQIAEGGEPEAVLPLSELSEMLGNGSLGGGGNITFAPTIQIQGSASKQDVEEATKASFEEFKRMWRQLQAEERRKNFRYA